MASILIVGKGPPERGGIPTFLQQLETAKWDSHRVSLLNLTHDGDREGGRLTTGNVWRTVTDAFRLSRVKNVDIVHIHSAMAPLPTLVRASALCVVARVRGRKVLLHAHGGRLVPWSDGRGRKWALAQMVWPAHQVAVVSAGLLDVMRTASVKSSVCLIPNGVDATRFRPAGGRKSCEADPVILFVGHLSKRKGVLDLLQASLLLEERGICHRLVMVGGVPDEGDNDRSEIDRAATASTEFAGTVDPDEMAAIYQAADLFCLPSWWEATPLSILEAMASGLPVVATTVGDVEVMVADAGWLVPPSDPAELADALALALTDRIERDRRGHRARQRVLANYDLAGTQEQLANIYDELSAVS